MPKQKIEIDVPDGYEFVRFGPVESGEWYIDDEGDVVFWDIKDHSAGKYIVIRPVEKWRVPTKLDLLNRDSIPCRVRDRHDQDWLEYEDLVAIACDMFICTDSHEWKQCEIRDTEPKPREFWIDVNSHHVYRNQQPIGTGIAHVVEVPE